MKNIEITASKRAMESDTFKQISDRNKVKQLAHAQENKEDIISAQELDHSTMKISLLETCISSAFAHVGATICRHISNHL